MTSRWSRVFTKPAGAIPGGLFGQIVVALTTLLIAAFIIAYAIQGGSTEEEAETTSGEPVLAGEGIQRRVEHEHRGTPTPRTDPQSGPGPRPPAHANAATPPGQQPGPGRPSTRTAGMTQGQPNPFR